MFYTSRIESGLVVDEKDFQRHLVKHDIVVPREHIIFYFEPQAIPPKIIVAWNYVQFGNIQISISEAREVLEYLLTRSELSKQHQQKHKKNVYSHMVTITHQNGDAMVRFGGE